MSTPEDTQLLADLAAWIRRHPDAWSHGEGAPMSDERMDDLVDTVLARRRAERMDNRRRRRRVLGITCVVVSVTGGAAAAALTWSGQPSEPQQGALCRAEADIDSSAIALGTGEDPIEGCELLWADGRFEEFGMTGGERPLAACVGPNGAIEVFPGPGSVCDELGLAAADPTLSPDNESILQLQERLIAEVNAVDCLTVDEAAATAEQILDQLGLEGWTAQVSSESQDGSCGKAAVDVSTQRVVINRL